MLQQVEFLLGLDVVHEAIYQIPSIMRADPHDPSGQRLNAVIHHLY
jgi:hypothetical protein